MSYSGEPVNMHYLGRIDRAFFKQNKEQIQKDWSTLMEMNCVKLVSIGPEAHKITFADMKGLGGKMSDIQQILQIAHIGKNASQINPNSYRKLIFINLLKSLEVLTMAQSKIGGVNTTLEILPRPYSLQRL